MPTAGWWEALWPAPREVLTALGTSRDGEVVDLCCGSGWFTVELAKLARSVVAIDIEPAMLEIAEARLAESGIGNCRLVAGDAYQIAQLAGHPTDFVFLANAFHGAPDKPRLARAVGDALKPGGCFAIVNWHCVPRERTTVLGEARGPRTELRMSPQDTVAAVLRAGFEVARIVEVPPYHYGAIFVRRVG